MGMVAKLPSKNPLAHLRAQPDYPLEWEVLDAGVRSERKATDAHGLTVEDRAALGLGPTTVEPKTRENERDARLALSRLVR